MQLQPVCGRSFILSSHVITFFKMVKLDTYVRCACDAPFEQLQQIIRSHYSLYTINMIREIRQLLRYVPTYVKNCSSNEIELYTYWIYGRKTPSNITTQHSINPLHTTIPQYQATCYTRRKLWIYTELDAHITIGQDINLRHLRVSIRLLKNQIT